MRIPFASGLGMGAVIAIQAFIGLMGIGHLYWMWLTVKSESFGLFLLSFFPLTCVVTGPLGAFSLLFGTPEWLVNMLS